MLITSCLVLAYNVPKNLRWGVSLADIESDWAASPTEDSPKIDKAFEAGKWDKFFYPKELVDKNESMRIVRLKDVTFLGKKVHSGYLVLDSNSRLVAFQYHIMPIEGDAEKEYQKCWQQYQTIFDALVSKYGTPNRNDVTSAVLGTDILKGTHYDAVWQDTTTSDQITLLITKYHWGTGLIGSDSYLVMLRFESPNFAAIINGKSESKDF
jgi:hypothetical protein